MYGLIYVVKNLVNGRSYVGQTTKKWPKRKNEHIISPKSYSAIDRAIKKYGPHNFSWEVIDYAPNQDVLNSLEKAYISHYDSMTTGWGYNIRHGGSNGPLSEETKAKLSKANSGVNGPNYGRNFTAEHRAKLSKASKGRRHTEEVKKKMSKCRKGVCTLSEEYIKSLPEKMKGKNNPFYGKHHTKEHRTKSSKTRWGKYPGVTFMKRFNPEGKCWQSQIQIKGKQKYLGLFEDPISGSILYEFVWNEIYN